MRGIAMKARRFPFALRVAMGIDRELSVTREYEGLERVGGRLVLIMVDILKLLRRREHGVRTGKD